MCLSRIARTTPTIPKVPHIITPPTRNLRDSCSASIFLAGSIEMGSAKDWQQEVIQHLANFDVTIYNPRRSDWNSDWKQSKENPNFYDQVTWELDHLDKADVIAMYFDPNTKSPISLLELGLYAKSGKLVVYSPDEFWRSGNVEIVCDLYGVSHFREYDTWLKEIERRLYNKITLKSY